MAALVFLSAPPAQAALLVIPALALGGAAVTQLAIGQTHVCAVANGGVRCWGNNADGQLGDNSTISKSTPVQTIAENSGVTQVSAGNRHTCAVVAGGLQCWGSNVSNRLGDNTAIDKLIPTQVFGLPAGSGVTAVAAGTVFSCALVAGGVSVGELTRWVHWAMGATPPAPYRLTWSV